MRKLIIAAIKVKANPTTVVPVSVMTMTTISLKTRARGKYEGEAAISTKEPAFANVSM